jgi:hypothetical protein
VGGALKMILWQLIKRRRAKHAVAELFSVDDGYYVGVAGLPMFGW